MRPGRRRLRCERPGCPTCKDGSAAGRHRGRATGTCRAGAPAARLTLQDRRLDAQWPARRLAQQHSRLDAGAGDTISKAQARDFDFWQFWHEGQGWQTAFHYHAAMDSPAFAPNQAPSPWPVRLLRTPCPHPRSRTGAEPGEQQRALEWSAGKAGLRTARQARNRRGLRPARRTALPVAGQRMQVSQDQPGAGFSIMLGQHASRSGSELFRRAVEIALQARSVNPRCRPRVPGPRASRARPRLSASCCRSCWRSTGRPRWRSRYEHCCA